MTCLRRVFSVGSRVSELVYDLQDRMSRQALHTEKTRRQQPQATCVYLQSLSDQLFQVAVRQIRMLSTSRTQYATAMVGADNVNFEFVQCKCVACKWVITTGEVYNKKIMIKNSYA